jgi:hypothetical protein
MKHPPLAAFDGAFSAEVGKRSGRIDRSSAYSRFGKSD